MAPRLRCATRERRVRGRPAPGRAPPRPAGLNSRLVCRGRRRRRTCRGFRFPVFGGRRFPCTRRHRGGYCIRGAGYPELLYMSTVFQESSTGSAASPPAEHRPFQVRSGVAHPLPSRARCRRTGAMDKAWTTPSAASPLFGRQCAGRGAPSGLVRFGRAEAVQARQRNIALFMQPSPADGVPRMPGWSDLAMGPPAASKRAMFRSWPIRPDSQ